MDNNEQAKEVIIPTGFMLAMVVIMLMEALLFYLMGYSLGASVCNGHG